MRELERKDDAIMDNYEYDYYSGNENDNDQKMLLTSDPLNDNSKKPGPPYEGKKVISFE